jgi:two-component system, sensor histidine kinase and response regulator
MGISPEASGGLELDVALARVGGDRELLQEIAALFVADFPNALHDIRAALERNEPPLLERAAHGLKGSVANFGARDAVQAAWELESMGRTGNLTDAAAVLARLEASLAALKVELQTL